MVRTTDIVSLTDYRQRLREHHDRLKATGRPLYITTNGEADAVVLSPEMYDELADRAELPEILAMIARSEADIREGRVTDAAKGLGEIAKRHGLNSPE